MTPVYRLMSWAVDQFCCTQLTDRIGLAANYRKSQSWTEIAMKNTKQNTPGKLKIGLIQNIMERDKLYLRSSIRFSKQTSFTIGLCETVIRQRLTSFAREKYGISYIRLIPDVMLQDYVTFVQQSFKRQKLSATFSICYFLKKLFRPPWETSSTLHALLAVYFVVL